MCNKEIGAHLRVCTMAPPKGMRYFLHLKHLIRTRETPLEPATLGLPGTLSGRWVQRIQGLPPVQIGLPAHNLLNHCHLFTIQVLKSRPRILLYVYIFQNV